MRILHLINDHQVIERTLGVYEELFPNMNEVLLFNKTKETRFLEKYASCTLVNYGNLKKIAKDYDFSDITYVIAHYMTMDKIDFIKYVPDNIHVCWEVYGFDLYNQFLAPNGYKIFYTNPSIYHPHSIIARYLNPLVKMVLLLKGNKYPFLWQKNRQFNYIGNRIDSIQYCCRYDAQFIEDYVQRKIPSYEVFNYSLSEVLGDLKNSPYSRGKNIMVGNSASFSNNHFYVLNYLQKIGINKDTLLILPLSYGGRKKYVDDIERNYRQQFPDQIETLRDYIPLHEYNKIFLRLNAVILSAWRQESQGTAIMAFYLGLKVFMSERSPLYKWFVDCGFYVYAIEKASVIDFEQSLSMEEKQYNRNIVVERYSEKHFEETLKAHFI